ncbi:hypothetical protein Taro_042006 [Colocasia esculenta]|uniref:Ricin B lectin domain-containing protein n=1 Tax=Colocasia esculenta TaxID=4460 RepID=A0A843WRI3_COLES|nr:hypothetical protein [Colocasia esculenta]
MKDETGRPGSALVNKATGLAIKHPVAAHRPLQLVPYSPYYVDETVLWTGTNADGAGYGAIRMINNVDLNLDAFFDDGRRVHGGVLIGVWEWNDGGNQKWKIVANSGEHLDLGGGFQGRYEAIPGEL